MSEVSSSRFGKKSNIKEMLIRNFFRQYPIALDTPDLDQLEIERNVGMQMEEFVLKNGSINSKALREFETRLAKDVGLNKKLPAPVNDIRSPLRTPNQVLSGHRTKRAQAGKGSTNLLAKGRNSSHQALNNKLARNRTQKTLQENS